MADQNDVRSLALDLPEASEHDHHGLPSFRVDGKIFCTIHQDAPRAMLKFSPEDQHNLCAGAPGRIEPVPGYWGRKGATFVYFERFELAELERLIRLAWAGVAPKRLRKPQGDA